MFSAVNEKVSNLNYKPSLFNKAAAKRWQHLNATHPIIVGPAFASSGQTITTFERNISQHCWAQHVARVWPPYCNMCEVEIELVRMPKRNIVAGSWPNVYNTMQHPQMLKNEKFDHFQI